MHVVTNPKLQNGYIAAIGPMCAPRKGVTNLSFSDLL